MTGSVIYNQSEMRRLIRWTLFYLRLGARLDLICIVPKRMRHSEQVWAASPIEMMLGSIIGGQFQDRAGRRISLATGAFLSAIVVAICYVADLPDEITARRGIFFVGKFFQGVCLGINLCVVQTYVSEVLPVLLRGPIIAFLPIFTLLGQLIGSVVVYTSLKYPGAQSYRIPFASQWPFSAVTFLLAAILFGKPGMVTKKRETGSGFEKRRGD
ncbi:uncharacterized protein N7477_006305 [Penicillium maclennaniae]|uniref:uncharacterized protein n=1 Tax=Penicillium maclennaniae TaxID=1343394 RepID=UPI0025413DE5|nr:uncharacterized protein N7477_006305 [Penicillium maclennaniae]KAJ5667735.1 hypothetical protein N7477_006305 [Penicillium maclennaniae]